MQIPANASTPLTLQLLCLLGASPLLAASDTLTDALGIGIALFASTLLIAVFNAFNVRWIHRDFQFASSMLTLAAIVSVTAQVFAAWLPDLQITLTIFIALIVPDILLLQQLHSRNNENTFRSALDSLRIVGVIIVVLLLLGALRELVGRGSLLHDATALFKEEGQFSLQLFPVDLGFLLAQSPPGSFIALGLLIAIYNAWSRWAARTTGTHEQEKDR